MVAKKGTNKRTNKRVMKKSKGTRKNRTRRMKKGGELSIFKPPREGECVKKGLTDLRTYKTLEVKSSGYGPPTILVENSDGQLERFNLRDMTRCNSKGGRRTRRRTRRRSRKH